MLSFPSCHCMQEVALHKSPFSAPLGLSKAECEMRMEEGVSDEEEEGEEEEESAVVGSEASFESTLYDNDR